MTDDQCGYETPNGPCQNPATNEDSCWIESHGGDVDGHGRPELLERHRDDVLQAARQGKSIAGCAREAGVDDKTLHGWLDRHPDFFREFTQARARGETVLVQGALQSDDVDTSMAKFLLSTSFDYVKTERREVDADVEHSGSLDLEGATVTYAEDTDDD